MDERFEEVLTISARLFREKGFRATSMEDIATEMGVTKAALYYYIESKHDLLYEICDTAINHLIEGVREIRPGARGPGGASGQAHPLARQHVRGSRRHHQRLPGGRKRAARGEKGVTCGAISREFEEVYREIIKEAMRKGEFRKLDVPMTVRAISGMCNWLSIWYRPDGRMSADRIADIF